MPTAVITGAASGLGKAIAEAMADHYTITDWSLPALDLRSLDAVSDAAEQLKRVDVLINCAGVNLPIDYLTRISAEEWDNIFAVNCRAIWLTAKHLAGKMQGGTILNIISSAAVQPMRCSLPYNASKAAVQMMTRQMARELKWTHDITVFGVSPGWLEGTPMTQATDERLKVLRDLEPVNDRIDPAAVAGMISYLLAKPERHKHLNGSIMEYGV
jgi:NAD(P)-dependent dehydrogenase (short-subunit alcohol dehydrogenase family)